MGTLFARRLSILANARLETVTIKSFLNPFSFSVFALTLPRNRGIVIMAQKGCGNANHRIGMIQHIIGGERRGRLSQ